MSVLFYAIRPCNDLDTIVANGRKQTVLHLFLDAALKTVAYLRVSTRSQDLANQKLAILEFSQKRRFPIDQFIESRISSRKSPLEPCLVGVDTVVFLAGKPYREFLEPSLRQRGLQVRVPMRGLRLGQQLAWLDACVHG